MIDVQSSMTNVSIILLAKPAKKGEIIFPEKPCLGCMNSYEPIQLLHILIGLVIYNLKLLFSQSTKSWNYSCVANKYVV